MTLPVSLAAAAVTLRGCMIYESRRKTCSKLHRECWQRRVVADLIDGMLGEHCPDPNPIYANDSRDYCRICDTLNPLPCPSLLLLVPLVRAFLPDWNPDTEETP